MSSPPALPENFDRKKTDLGDKYRSMVRQLPSKEYIEVLARQFFSEINWQYDVLDETTFYQQLEGWRQFPYSAHSQVINTLPANVLAFPCLISQVMAHSLRHQPAGERASSSLEPLKYVSGMTFVDLACDLSEAGYSMIESIEKKDMSVVAVQTGILRASFLKNTGSVIEAWHVVGTTIRNAQEIGLHVSTAAPNPLASIDAQWDHELKRRVWFVLHNWDIHMAVVLGRPMTTNMAAGVVDLPNDLAQRESGRLPRKRMEQDDPTPFSVIRLGYDIAYKYFPRIRELEQREARREDYHIVGETHAAIEGNLEIIPPWCRHSDPDTQFDQRASCHWLPAARQSLMSGIYFVLLSLHRPYIFSFSESRTKALKAALMVFTSQKRLFHLSEPEQYPAFNMVYPLLDAMVISLAVLVLFPKENHDLRSDSVENVYWGLGILANMGQHNAMAWSANAVVKTLLSRLEEGHEHALQHQNSNGDEGLGESLSSGTSNPHDLGTSSHTASTANDQSTSDLAGSSSLLPQQALATASTNPNLDFETLLPPRPVGDLFQQDLYAPMPDAIQDADSPVEFLRFDGRFPAIASGASWTTSVACEWYGYRVKR